MCRKVFMWASVFFILLGGGFSLLAQDDGEEKNILSSIVMLAGAGEEESLCQEVLDRFERWYERPLAINFSSSQKLLASGLFSPYQVAVIEDYRHREGDIFSIMELACLDGFNLSLAQALEPFLSFASGGLDVDGGRKFSEGKMSLQGGWSTKGWSEALKFRYVHRKRWEMGLALSNRPGQPLYPIGSVGGHWTWHGRSHLNQLVLGDFNARFGQGLGLWSGFSLHGLRGSSSFCRRPSGITPSVSCSGSNFCGLAAEFSWGRWFFSSALTCPSFRPWMEGKSPLDKTLLPLVNISRYGRNGQIGLTAFSELGGQDVGGRAAMDFRHSFRWCSWWGELAFDWLNRSLGGLVGGTLPLGYKRSVSWIARGYPARFITEYASSVTSASRPLDEWGIGGGLEWDSQMLTLDWAWHPVAQEQVVKAYYSGGWNWGRGISLGVRLTDQWKENAPGKYCNRVGGRLDWKWEGERFLSSWRLEAAHSEEWGLLSYVELGYRDARCSAFLRTALFRVDRWADRIYVYERDFPGSFNVPVCYGRGGSVSGLASYRFRWGRESLKVYLRGGLRLFSSKSEKPGRAELKVQCVYSF